MKQPLIYSALFAFTLSAAAPGAMALAHSDDGANNDTRSMDSGAHGATDQDRDTRRPTDPRDPTNSDGAGNSGSGTGTGTGTGTGSGTGTGTSGGAGSTGAGTGGAGSGGASGAGAGAGG